MWVDEEESPFGATDEAPAEEAAAAAEPAAPPVPTGPREKCDPPHYTYHWVRPLYLNYRYIQDYRQNYYNDVINWMDKRRKGLECETPRAQEWAERALRTYIANNKNPSVKRTADMGVITKMSHVPRHYSYHTKAYYSLKYQKVL